MSFVISWPAKLKDFGAIRTHVLGQDARAPTSAELAEERRLAAKGMCEGAYGLSTGLFYPPQSFAKTDEVAAVASESGKRGGMYDTHQRDESNYSIGLLASTREAIAIGKSAGTPVHFAHLKALGVPVAELLGGFCRREAPVVGYLFIDEPEANARKAAAFVDAGYTELKLKVGRDFGQDHDTIAAIPDRLGPGDRPHAYGKAEARAGRKMGHVNHITTIDREK